MNESNDAGRISFGEFADIGSGRGPDGVWRVESIVEDDEDLRVTASTTIHESFDSEGRVMGRTTSRRTVVIPVAMARLVERWLAKPTEEDRRAMLENYKITKHIEENT